MRTRASSKDEEPIKIRGNIKKITRSTACYEIIEGENYETKNKLCCDNCKKLLDDPISVRNAKGNQNVDSHRTIVAPIIKNFLVCRCIMNDVIS